MFGSQRRKGAKELQRLCAFAPWRELLVLALFALPTIAVSFAQEQSAGCVSCHGLTDSPSMHTTGTVQISCVNCHGGNGDAMKAESDAKRRAHVQPRNSVLAKSAANPIRIYADWLKEDAAYIKFVNPGDLRVAAETCGACHAREVRNVQTSMMTHGGMLWQAALYNNGADPYKNARFSESYSPQGFPQRINAVPQPTAEMTRTKGILPFLDPLPRWK